jgi:hypothetical protein
VHVLRTLRDEPQRLTRPIDLTYEIVLAEYAQFRDRLGPGIVISKSCNMGGVELNYERTWSQGRSGIPIFTNEDRIAGANLMGQLMARMGVVLSQAEDGNVILMPGLGTVERDGTLIESRMRMVVRAVLSTLCLLKEWEPQRNREGAHA